MLRFALPLAILLIAITCCHAEEDVRQLVRQASEAATQGNHAQAVALLDRAIALDNSQAGIYRLRGREHFCSGSIAASIKDFDRVAELAPGEEKSLWERGISHYYAGRFDDGAKQFALYQTFHNADVENAAWRYLCTARADGLEKARETILPIEGDRRVPMMEIYAMYQGKLKPADVLAAAQAGAPDERELNQRLFYAHLYIGLFHEVAGEQALAKKHIAAAVDHPIGHYMHDVARVHWQRWQP